MHLTTPTPVATLLALDGVLHDYTTLAERLDGRLPVLHAGRPRIPPDRYALASRALAQRPAVTIPSHMGRWEAPSDFNTELTRFLASWPDQLLTTLASEAGRG
jgi:hypothetical protein